MATQEIFGNGSINRVEIGRGNREIVLSLISRHKEKIPDDIWNTSLRRINGAFEEFYESGELLQDSATSAFFVHTRRNRNGSVDVPDRSLEELDDSARCFPALSPKYGIPEDEVEKIWNFLPPFKVGEIKGTMSDKKINCAIISVPITPKALEECRSPTERANYARPRIYKAAELADRMGANVIGLGETLAALTYHGKSLQDRFPTKDITTGHAFTVYFMNEWTKFAAEKGKIDIRKSPVTIIGANGSIGSAMIEMLLLEGVSELRLHDREDMVGALEKRRKEILGRYPNEKVKVTGGDSRLKEACGGSRIVLVATSSPMPFIKAEHLDEGTFVINDSQPPSITREEAQKASSITLWVAGALPKGLIDTFDSGLKEGDWTCTLEVIALEIEGAKAFETVGPVTPKRVRIAGEIAKKLGMALTAPQSWGVIEDISSFLSRINLQ